MLRRKKSTCQSVTSLEFSRPPHQPKRPGVEAPPASAAPIMVVEVDGDFLLQGCLQVASGLSVIRRPVASVPAAPVDRVTPLQSPDAMLLIAWPNSS